MWGISAWPAGIVGLQCNLHARSSVWSWDVPVQRMGHHFVICNLGHLLPRGTCCASSSNKTSVPTIKQAISSALGLRWSSGFTVTQEEKSRGWRITALCISLKSLISPIYSQLLQWHSCPKYWARMKNFLGHPNPKTMWCKVGHPFAVLTYIYSPSLP